MKKYVVAWKNKKTGCKGEGDVLMVQERNGKVPMPLEEVEELVEYANRTFIRGSHWVKEKK